MRLFARRLEMIILSFTMPLPNLLSQQKQCKTFYDTQTGRDYLLFMSMIDPLLSVSLSMVGSKGIFFFDFIILS